MCVRERRPAGHPCPPSAPAISGFLVIQFGSEFVENDFGPDSASTPCKTDNNLHDDITIIFTFHLSHL